MADWHERASVAAVDMGAHMIVTEVNDQTLIDMKSLIHDEGVSTFKLFTAYPDVLMIDDGQIFKDHASGRRPRRDGADPLPRTATSSTCWCRRRSTPATPAPSGHMLTRPTLMEGEATHRVIRIAELAEAPVYIVHLSAGEALDAVTEARDRGLPVHAETCPHYLFLTDEEYERPGFEGAKFVMTPPLRGAAHQHALWRGLKTDDLQVIATDHCPFCFSENVLGLRLSKELGRDDFSKIPNGAPGLETRMPLVYDGGVRRNEMSLNRYVELTATAPAKLFGLFPRKGTIAVGSDADIVLFDPNETWTVRAAEHHSRVEYSLFEGREVTGRVNKVFLRGELIVDGREWLGREGGGQFLKRGQAGKAK